MSNANWIGGAPATAQVTTITPGGSIATSDVNNVPVKDESGTTVATITYIVGGTTTATDVAGHLITNWNANPITAALATASGTSTVILTATNAGVPFHVTSNVAGSGTLTTAPTTANSGPNDWATAANWSNGTVPITSDHITIDGRGPQAISYGLNQSGVTLASLTVAADAPLVGQIAIPLTIGVTLGSVPRPYGTSNAQGVKRLNINTSTIASSWNIQTTATTTIDNNLPNLRIAGSNASNTAIISGGFVGFGVNNDSEAAQYPTITVSGGTVVIGNSFTAGGTLTAAGGTVIANNRPGGNIFGSLVLSGTSAASNPLVDFSNNVAAFTVASVTLGPGRIRVASNAQGAFTAITPNFGTTATLTTAYV